MIQPLPLPAQVRCNRGFGWAFGMVLAIVCPLTVILMIGTREREPGGALVGLAVGVLMAGIFCLVRALLPRLVIDLAQGVLRTRTREEQFSAIAGIEFVSEKAGVWATFVGDDGRKLARMSVADTMFAAPTAEQWAALRQVIQLAVIARGVAPEQQPSAPRRRLSPARVLDIVEAQTAWCLAGHRSGARQAPAAELRGASVSITASMAE